MMRCALVEYNWYHDLVIPTLVYALNQLGFDVDVYQPRRALAVDPFCFSPGLRYRTFAIDGTVGKLRGTPNRLRRYDLTIANSIEPVEVLRATEQLGGPVLAIVHNATLPLTNSEYAGYFEPRRRAPIVLAKHISEYLAPRMAASWVAPVFFGDVPRPTQQAQTVEFSVQGNFAFDRRNYDSLLAASEELIASGETGFKVRFVGSSDTPDGEAFRATLAKSPAEPQMEFTEPGIPYRDFYRMLAAADFILPLVDTSTPLYENYYTDKATTSLMISIGLGVLPVLHSVLAQVYELEDAAICYEDGQLGDAMLRAIDIAPDDGTRLRSRLAARRNALLAQSVANLRRAVDAVS
jgi:hypothetical protein